MKPRERIIGALERSPAPGRSLPDRVPVMEMAIDWKIVRGLDCSGYFDLIERLDLDGVTVNQVMYLLGLRPLVIFRN